MLNIRIIEGDEYTKQGTIDIQILNNEIELLKEIKSILNLRDLNENFKRMEMNPKNTEYIKYKYIGDVIPGLNLSKQMTIYINLNNGEVYTNPLF